MKESKALNILLLIAKILLAILLSVSFIYYAITLIDAYMESLSFIPAENGISIDPYPLTFAFVLIFSAITGGASMLLALLALILSLIYKDTPKRKRNVLTFSLFLASPLVFEAVILLFGLFTGVFS